MDDIITIFNTEKTCEYRGEFYRVRDNGSIYRLRKLSRKRQLDEKWTFGKINSQKGYLIFSSEAVHRIVATAFLGAQPTDKHIVDHIDTNKQNNRPENLRWVTRLENIFLNPITLSRIIFKYGSIYNFLSNPSNPLDGNLDQNFDWMRTVTKEESDNTKENLLKWAQEGKIPKGGQLGEWIFLNLDQRNETQNKINRLTDSLTPFATQKNWKTKCEFPSCPTTLNELSIITYKDKLVKGSIFSKNQYGESIVAKIEITENGKELVVITTSDNAKPFALSKIYVLNEKFVHESIGSYFDLNSASKAFAIAIGQEWTGGKTLEDLIN